MWRKYYHCNAFKNSTSKIALQIIEKILTTLKQIKL